MPSHHLNATVVAEVQDRCAKRVHGSTVIAPVPCYLDLDPKIEFCSKLVEPFPYVCHVALLLLRVCVILRHSLCKGVVMDRRLGECGMVVT
jgi:hypothetical protein